jgi:uncharacterized protein YuzE
LNIGQGKQADTLYILVRNAPVDDSVDIEEGVPVDLDEKRRFVGIEIDERPMLRPS